MATYYLRAGSLQHYAALARERGLPRHHGFDSWMSKGERIRLVRLVKQPHPEHGEFLYSEWHVRWFGDTDRMTIALGFLVSDLPALKRKMEREASAPPAPAEGSGPGGA